jgi:hypothetical protein
MMNIEAAIHDIERRYPNFIRGETALPGNIKYESAKDLDFHLCRCAYGEYGVSEYVATGIRGGVHHVGVDSRKRKISVGPKGYHRYQRPVCRG